MGKDKEFSSEIVEFSKLVDSVFNEISKDIVELKLKLEESLKEVATLKVSLKKEIEKVNTDSSITKSRVNEVKRLAETTNKNLKRANVVSESGRTTSKLNDKDFKAIESALSGFNERIKAIENKLKL